MFDEERIENLLEISFEAASTHSIAHISRGTRKGKARVF